MKKYLIPENGQFYKANLHCHTTVSDGRLSPEEVKALYKEHGYSVIAFTDHDVFIPHPELNDESFLALNGFEVEIGEKTPSVFGTRKQCHMCFVALDEHNDTQPMWHRSEYIFANALNYKDRVKFDESQPDYVRSYTPECINDMIRIGKENNFFVTYNHPRWSMEEYPNYMAYNGMDAMEIVNYSCLVSGFWDYNGVIYDEMLRNGKRLFCIATDDNHRVDDACGGYIMLKAPALTYKDITNALKSGDFYASTGPEILDLWYEDGTVHIATSKASKIILSTALRRQKIVSAKALGTDAVTEADFRLEGDEGYFRITVIDAEGNTADTNAWFLDTLNG